MEMSSKVPVGRFREVIQAPKKVNFTRFNSMKDWSYVAVSCVFGKLIVL